MMQVCLSSRQPWAAVLGMSRAPECEPNSESP